VLEVIGIGQPEFGFGFIFFVLSSGYESRRRRGGNVEIRRFLPDFQARWKEWETRFLSFPRFPRGVISTALFLSAFSERSDARPVTAPVQG
jgi:hypothetical protein